MSRGVSLSAGLSGKLLQKFWESDAEKAASEGNYDTCKGGLIPGVVNR